MWSVIDMARHLTKEQVKAARAEYCANPAATSEYLAAKYNIGPNAMQKILSNISHFDPDYTKPSKKANGKKKSIFIPDHIQEMKSEHVPANQTLHRARGQNYVINKFS